MFKFEIYYVKNKTCLNFLLVTLILISNSGTSFSQILQTFTLSDDSKGRKFEGIGALSAGASSRLLYDYQEPYRSEILDYLFKPHYGANLHHLKVEIGGDVMSTDGSEPSHARTRAEMLNPKPEYYNRGYEWWLMKEAKERNPDIILEALEWGAPGWIGKGQIYSQDNADYVVAFVKGAKTYHSLTFDYVGITNERSYDKEYIKVLRKTLDRNGLQSVKIDAVDLWEMHEKHPWIIADDMLSDQELHDAVAVLNAHVPEVNNNFTPLSARLLNKPIWNGEAHAYGGDWPAASMHAKINMRAYPAGKITKIISWSVISSCYDYLLEPRSGMMKAKSPWSGYYEVQPPLWIIAQTNQFVSPGWFFIESGCDLDSINHWSINTIQDSITGNYSIIIETIDALDDIEFTFKQTGSFRSKDLSVWRSCKDALFINEKTITPVNHQFTLKAQKGSVYTITTTRGQMKGVAITQVPAEKPFPIPYHEDFNLYKTGSQPKYLSDLHGCFEVVTIPGKKDKCLKQSITIPGITWMDFDYPMSILGDIKWKDYRFSCDFMIPDTGFAAFRIRTNNLYDWSYKKYEGYEYRIQHDGKWYLTEKENILATGIVNKDLKNFWNQITMEIRGNRIGITLNNQQVTSITISKISEGVPAIRTGWNVVYFDNIIIEKNN